MPFMGSIQGVFGFGRSISNPPFSPTNIGGLQVWLDGNDPNGTGVTPANGTSISTWTDKSGNGRNGVNAATAATVVTNALGGKAVLNCPGTARYNITYSSIPASYSAFCVYLITTNNGSWQRALHGASDSTLFLGVQGANVATFTGNGSSWNDTSANSPNISALNTYRIVDMINNSTVSPNGLTPYVNGTAQNTKNSGPNSFNNLIVASHSDNSQRLQGRIAELMFYTGILSTTSRQQVEGYLAWKWGLQGSLPAGHPYKNAPP
jgi:hypothetical protein